ncbi:NAD(P)-dependent oxidoreductase [Rhodococcus sp. KBS0724]|jgi:SDR family mycofactocin-dependent oxidoreductase|uniref:mycofactocin-coupled SDR family oxidoreductase n=1 Tax=Rhodococcus sp. KBS0724 TaxID=1179674 RepID=UPI00110E4383|nr:mycofactocin-coupled SDR family oxidoreductase [Rhodococcus sp. KBS0724]TSD49173.1 NAD(P)-dependent oxidoreductase [Rhodococcus sp. KBS0724]
MGRVEGKVAFITGAGRGQGRSHAVRLAEEGADIIAVDICADFDSITYPMATPEDLEETARLVEKHGRRIVTAKADVRKVDELRAALERGVAELGHLDIVVAQAGVAGMRGEPDIAAWSDTVDTNLVGTINAIQAALPYLGKGASIIATGSTASMIDTSKVDVPGKDLGGVAYVFSKRALSHYVHELATHLAPRGIRANVVHPTNCNTDMLHNESMYKSFRPDLENPGREDAVLSFPVQQAMQIPWVEPEDISETVLFLASEQARYVTGMQMRVDGGGYLKSYDYHI